MTLLLALFTAAAALAQKHYDPGVTDTEIRIGQTMPLSGPASGFSTLGKAQLTLFKMINDQGGVNGRKIMSIFYDDAYSPAKMVEQARKLVEQDHVLLLFGTTGTPPNLAARKYLNDRKVPQLFLISGAPQFNDPKNYPWSVPGSGNYRTEGRIDAKYILKNKPDAKIAVLYQNDDFGKSLLAGLRQELGDKADTMIVAAVSYEPSDPTIDSQIITLASSGATVFADYALPKFLAQGIRKSVDLGWRPLHIIAGNTAIAETAFKPAGYQNAIGIISVTVLKDPADPQWANAPDFKAFKAWMEKYNSSSPDPNSVLNSVAFGSVSMLVEVLKQCGDNITRSNIVKIATTMDYQVPMFLPGIRYRPSPGDYDGFKAEQLTRFDGVKMVPIGQLIEVR
jgi:ABC-type branched-subunit amino acid transport system substrate-binding protein